MRPTFFTCDTMINVLIKSREKIKPYNSGIWRKFFEISSNFWGPTYRICFKLISFIGGQMRNGLPDGKWIPTPRVNPQLVSHKSVANWLHTSGFRLHGWPRGLSSLLAAPTSTTFCVIHKLLLWVVLTLFPFHVFCKVPFDTRFNYLLTLIQSLESLQITQSVKNNEKMTQIAAIANISTFAFHFIPNMISLLWSKQQAVI